MKEASKAELEKLRGVFPSEFFQANFLFEIIPNGDWRSKRIS